jgi:rhomboid protease GluP
MDIDGAFFLLAMVACVATLVRIAPALRQGRRGGSWAAVAALILGVGVLALIFVPDHAGALAGTIWAVFVVVPSILHRAGSRYALGARYKKAELCARIGSWLHPATGWRALPVFYRALALAQAGQRDRAALLFHGLMDRPGAPNQIAAPARMYLWQIEGQWDELLAWMEGGFDGQATLASRPGVMVTRVRALGETGRLSDLLLAFQTAARARSVRLGSPTLLAQCQLWLFAFGSREATVTRLLEGPLAGLKPGVHEFWRATARMAAGNTEVARANLRSIAERSDDEILRHAIKRRMTRDLPNAEATLSPAEKAAIDGIEAQLNRDRAYHPAANAGLRQAYATCAIILLNLGVFALETVRGGSENLRTLSRLGALWAPAVLEDGQWYRLVTALFLHLGPFHLAMNLLALAWIGPWVEKTLGWARYVAVYFVSGIGSMAAVILFIQLGWMQEEMLVGASGAIMGLIGATGALLLAGRLRERSALAGKRLLEILVIVGLQVVFDLLTPQVSFAAHAGGLVIGFLATALLIAPSLAAGRQPSIAPSPPGK